MADQQKRAIPRTLDEMVDIIREETGLVGKDLEIAALYISGKLAIRVGNLESAEYFARRMKEEMDKANAQDRLGEILPPNVSPELN